MPQWKGFCRRNGEDYVYDSGAEEIGIPLISGPTERPNNWGWYYAHDGAWHYITDPPGWTNAWALGMVFLRYTSRACSRTKVLDLRGLVVVDSDSPAVAVEICYVAAAFDWDDPLAPASSPQYGGG